MVTRASLSIALSLSLVGGCLLLDPLDDTRLGAGGDPSVGGGGMGGAGGTGGSGGEGGGGGVMPCDDVQPSVCNAVAPVALSSTVNATDMAFSGSGTVTVGTFTGNVIFDGIPLNAPVEARGFVVAHDQDGTAVAAAALPEATAESRLHVTVHTDGSIAVGGNFGTGSACIGNQGLFIHRLVQMNPSFESFDGMTYPHCTSVDATFLEANDIAISDAGEGYISLVGAIDGTIASLSSVGVDGFVYELPPPMTEAPNYFLFGGNGDSAIRGLTPNPSDTNQWLMVGDFSGELNIAIPNTTKEASAGPSGDRDLFIVGLDRYEASPNLSLIVLGGTGGNHRAVGLATIGGQTTPYLLAKLDGALQIPGSTLVPASAKEAAIVMAFTPPNDGGTNYAHSDHVVVEADQLDVIDITSGGDHFHIGGHASGNIDLAYMEGSTGTEAALGCQRDAFLMTVMLANQGSNIQRCGDGQQTLLAVARHSVPVSMANNPATIAAALLVLPNASIEFANGPQPTVDDAQPFLLFGE